MMPGVYEAVIFDMDGTLLDTLDDLADCMNRVLRRHGRAPHPVDAYRYFVGDGLENLVIRSLPRPDRSAEVVATLKEAMRSEYAEHWADKTHPYEGIPELLGALQGRGVRQAILSNKPHAFTQQIAAHYFPQRLFEQVVGAREGAPRKPDPGAALEIARALGVGPDRFLYFGDTNTDMRTGRGAGMFTVGVTWGFRPREELLENGAQALVERPAEVLRFFVR
jgi:phosphoglycolate phosphatase